jgi:protoporphyrinogen oxidase
VILGAGPAGLAAADVLSDAGAQVAVLETLSEPGGLARSHRIGEHLADLGPHRLHAEASEETRAHFGALTSRVRRGRLHLGTRALDYPLHPLRTLFDLGVARAATYAAGAVAARVKSRGDGSFREVGERRVGAALFRDLYAPAAEKIWGAPADALDGDQARARIAVGGARGLIGRLLGRSEPGHYLYPSTGANGLAYKAWAERLAARGVVFHFDSDVRAVLHHDRRVTAVRARSGGASVVLPAERVLSTIALPRLLERVMPAIEADTAELSLRSVVILYVVLARSRLGFEDVNYFADASTPFARMTEQAAFGRNAGAPENETVVAFDFYDAPGGAHVRAEASQLFELAWPTLASFGVRREEIVAIDKTIGADAYPVFARGYRHARERALDAAASVEGLITTGRGGLFLHVNQHHAIEMGATAARVALRARDVSRSWRDEARRFEGVRVVD